MFRHIEPLNSLELKKNLRNTLSISHCDTSILKKKKILDILLKFF